MKQQFPAWSFVAFLRGAVSTFCSLPDTYASAIDPWMMLTKGSKNKSPNRHALRRCCCCRAKAVI